MRAALRRVIAITRKEFIHIRRDPRTLMSVLLMPVIQLLLFSYAISFDVGNVPTVILDQDRTTASREYLAAFEHSEFFRVVDHIESDTEADNAFDTSQAKVALIIRPGFADAIAEGHKAEVAILIDGSEPNSAQLGRAYAVALSSTEDRHVLVSWAENQGLDMSAVGGLSPQIRTWYNPDRRSADFLIPGLMVVIIMIVTIQQTAVSLVKERDQGTFEQLTVSPIRRAELMVGKVLPWVLLAFVETAVIVAVGVLLFGVPLRGSVLALALGSVLFVFSSLAIGLLISVRASSVEVANMAGLLISFLPGFMLSGFAFPLESIPPALQFISYLFPGRYMMVIARSVFLKGADVATVLPQLIALGLYTLVSLTIASLAYSRRLS
ncbi:MAG: ABC transporter permease [Coriobacteriia bacterium]|nr:ABC transporter permease [Coriobacteriia bacterium]